MEQYDIIGDVHGCYDALRRLCEALGYDADFHHPEGRVLVFVGDLVEPGAGECAGVAAGRHAWSARGGRSWRWATTTTPSTAGCAGRAVDTGKGGLDKTIARD